jgi:2-keto-4-pentenoate hydratase/2-oxohepta-3-ene-1,7-dioic acid hydratase in catechol pathway
LLRFDAGSGPVLGALVGDTVVDIESAAQELEPAVAELCGRGMMDVINAGTEALRALGRVIANAGKPPDRRWSHAPESVRFLAPVPFPSKIIAVGQNYLDHIREQKIEPPAVPILFSKAPTSIVGPGDGIRWPAGLTQQVDPEAELGVIVGRRMKGAARKDALDFVFGYTALNDVSARDLQFGDKQWVRGKSLDTFCPMGPVLVTRDEIPDPQALDISLSVSGRVWQKSNTREMIFPVARLLSFISQGITLLPGDVIATGTPHGVGMFQKPPVFLKAGDKLRLEVERIGILENPVLGPC